MTNFKSLLAEDRRLAILRVLAGDSDYATNDSVMQSALDRLGHSESREVIRADFGWLEDVGLVQVERVLETLYVAKLTHRGVDVAEGRAIVPGVKRPRPGS